MFDGVLHTYIVSVLFLLFFWCPCMAIDVNAQYNGGLLPDIILLTQYYYHRGTGLNAMKRFFICSFRSHLTKRFDVFSPLTGGCSRRSRRVMIFFKNRRGLFGALYFFYLFVIFLLICQDKYSQDACKVFNQAS